MLSDKEIQAIDLLKSYENKLVYEISEKDKKAVKTILNLIEKQSKEIEELKTIIEAYNIIPNEYIPNNMKLVIADMEYFKDGILKETMISKSKIKAKIEEIKEEVKTCSIYKKTGCCTNNCKEDCEYYDFIDILQSLLEKE